ncbi:MAG: IS3 family transposase [Ferruginibacter sp.]|jgi:transposase InsO family protein
MKGYYPSVGFAKLCGLFGKTRQAVYDITWRQTDELLKEDLILHLVGDIRADLPKIGGVKLYYLLQEKIAAHGIKIGRDSFFDLLRANNLLIKRKRKYVVTTLSRHKFKIWPNLIEALIVNRPEQLWVSDITYLRTKAGFVYLFLITDAYSRKIMGYHLSQGLKVKGCIIALNKAITSRYYPGRALIHHSDRGIQYCCNSYVSLLKQENLQISMTQTGSPYDNAIAERINGILKTELGLDQVFESYNSAVEPIAKSIHAYNNLRPHMSCDFLTPEQAHQREGSLKKHWKKIIHHQDRQFLQHQ